MPYINLLQPQSHTFKLLYYVYILAPFTYISGHNALFWSPMSGKLHVCISCFGAYILLSLGSDLSVFSLLQHWHLWHLFSSRTMALFLGSAVPFLYDHGGWHLLMGLWLYADGYILTDVCCYH